MAEVANLVVSFNATGQQAVSSAANKVDGDITRLANNSVGSANRIGGAFASAGKVVALGFGVIAAAGIANAAKGFLMANANAEQYRISLETVTGSQEKANKLFTDLQAFAASTPFEFPELVQAATNLEAFGLKTQDWIGTIGDTASAMGKTVDQVTQAVLDAQTGSYERLKELGIAARVEGDKLHLSYMENGKKITETVDRNNQEVVNSTIQGIWNKKYEGAMERQSKTFLGQWSTLKDNFNMTMQEMTKPVFEFAKKGLSAANRFFKRFNDKRALGFGVWKAAMASLHTSLNQVFGPATGGAIIGVIRGIGSAVSTVIDITGGLIEAFGTGRGVAAIFRDLPAPIRGVATALGSIADAVGDVVRAFQADGFAGAFAVLGEEAKQIASAGIDLGVIVVKGLFKVVTNVVGSLWDWFKAQLGLGGNATAAMEGPGDGSFSRGTNGTQEVPFGTVLVTAALKLGGQIAEWVGNLWGWLKGQLGLGGGSSLGAVPLGGGAVVPSASKPINIGDVFIAAAIKLDQAVDFSGLATSIKNGALRAIDGLTSFGSEVGAKVGAKLKEISAGDIFGSGEGFGIALRTAIGDVISKIDLSGIDWSSVATKVGKGIVTALTLAALAPLAVASAIALFIAGALKGVAFGDDSFAEISTKIGDGIVAGVGKLQSLTNDLLMAIAMKLVVTGGNFLLEGQNIANQIGAAIITGVNTLSSIGNDMLLAIASKLVVVSTNFIAEGQSIANQIGAAIQTALNAIANFDFSGLATNIAAALVKYITPDMIEGAIGAAFSAFGGDSDTTAVTGGAGAGAGSTLRPIRRNDPTRDVSWNRTRLTLPRHSRRAGVHERIARLDGVRFDIMYDQPMGGGQADFNAPPPPMMFPPPDLSKFTAELGKVPIVVNQQMTAATSGAQSGAQALSTAVVSTISAMVPAVMGQLSTLVSSVTAQFGAMVASGSGQMAAFVGAVSSGFATMQAVAVGATSSMVGSVIGILSSLPGYGFGIGASLGSGIAGGIQSMIGSVAASAAALVAAAVNAARQAGAISSPSKKTMYLGSMMGEGLVVGMDRMQGRVAQSMANLMPTPSLAGSSGYSVPPISRSRNAQARIGDTYIIQGDLLEPREWQNRVRTLAAEGAVTIVDRRMATQQVARR